MNGHLKRVLILLLIFTFVFQMAGVTSLSRVQAYADTETAETIDVPEADEAEDMTAEEIDTESPGEIETDGENPPDAAEEPSDPETVPEETAEVPEETAAEEETSAPEETAEEAAEEPAPVKAPVLKAATKAEKLGTVLAFTSDAHNRSGNVVGKRIGTWIDNVESKHGDIDVMAFGGDMGAASWSSGSEYWTYTQADMSAVADKGVTGVYTTGNHEYSMGGDFKYNSYTGNSYSSTETKGQFKINTEGAEGEDYRIYCLGSVSDSNSYTSQVSALESYLSEVGNSKPIFIITHFPLHKFGSRKTTGAKSVIDVLNAAVQRGQMIVFLWGHNHTESDTYYDQIYGPGTVLPTNDGNQTIQFYYGAAGCMSDSENGTGSEYVKGKGLVVTINQNSGNATMGFTYYNEAGTDVTEKESVRSVEVEISDPIPATGVTINEVTTGNDGQPVGKSIAAGKTLQLHLTLEPAGASSSGITWSSSDESVATVSDKGLVTAKKEGKTTITAAVPSGTKAAPATSSIEITVTAAPKEVSITPTSSDSPEENATIDVGETLKINVTNGSSSSYNYTAALSNSGIAQIEGNATVSIAGNGTGQFTVTGLANGTVDITIQNNGTYSTRKGTIHLTVNGSGGGGDDPVDPPAGDATVDITPSTSNPEVSATIDVDETLVINVTNSSTHSGYTFAATLSKSGVAEFQGSSSVEIAQSSTGQLTVKGLANGTVDINITNNNSSSERKAVVHLTVGDGGGDDPIPTGKTVDVTPDSTTTDEESITIDVDETFTINVTNGSSSSAYNFTATLSKEGVAEIQGNSTINIAKSSTGQFTVKGLTNGTVDINIQNDGQYSTRKAIVHLTVGDGGDTPADTVDYVLTDTMEAGEKYLIATGNNGNAFILSNESGSVNNSLKGYSVNVVNNKISITETVEAKTLFEASGDNNNSIRLKLDNQYLYADGNGALRMVNSISDAGKFWHYKAVDNGTEKRLLWFFNGTDGDYGYTATGSYKYYLKVDSNGNFTKGYADNNTTISTVDTPKIYLYKEIEEVIPATDLTVSPTNKSILVGENAQFTATVTPEDATGTVTWTSNAEAVATVDSTGKVTGVGVGTATITATIDGLNATCTVIVDPVPVSSVTLNKATATVMATKTLQLESIVEPENATDKTVTWTSSNPAIASVDQTGKVTGVAIGGPVTITATAGGKSATCEVTVTEYVAPTGYVILIDGYALSNVHAADNVELVNSTNYHYKGLNGVEYTDAVANDPPASILWTITETNGGYYIQDSEGNYLNAVYTATTNPTGCNADLKVDNVHDVWKLEGTLEDWQIDGSTLKSTNADKSMTYEESVPIFTIRSTGETSTLEDPSHPIATETRYIEVSSFTDNKNFIIAVTKDDGSVYALKNTSGTISAETLDLTIEGEDTFIITDDTGVIWKYGVKSSSNTSKYLANNSSYLTVGNSSLSMGSTGSAVSYSGTKLQVGSRYLRYNSGFTTTSTNTNSGTDIRLFQEKKVVTGPSISLDKETMTVPLGETGILTALIKNAEGASITWSSSNEGVATVNNGTVTGVSAGTATITASMTYEGETYTAACTVTVKQVKTLTFDYVSEAETGKTYVIISNGYALVNNNGAIAAVLATVSGNTVTLLDDEYDEANMLWTVGEDGSFKNGNYYVRRQSGSTELDLTLNTATETKYTNWAYDGTYVNVMGGNSSTTEYVMYYNSGWKTYTKSNAPTDHQTKLYGEAVAPHEHTYGTPSYEWTAITDGYTCTATATCSGCEEGTEGHSVTETVTAAFAESTPATCTATGSGTYTATFQNELFDNQTKDVEIPMVAHTLQHHDAVLATCTSNGNVEYWSCSICNKNFSDAAGTTELTTVDVPALGHNMTAHAAKAATCTEAGNSAYWSCDRCNKYFSDAEGNTEVAANSWVISATGHNPDEAVHEHEVASTCTSQGSYDEVVYCTVCGAEISREAKTTPALGHNMTSHAAVAATCTEAGNSAYWSCDRCNKYFSDAEGNTEIEVDSWIIPAAGHVPGTAVHENEVAATCTTAGNYDEVVYCSVCHVELSREAKTVPATGHVWGEVSYTWADDYSKVTASRACTKDPTHVESEEATTTYAVITEPTETTAGVGRYTSEAFENAAFTVQTKDIELPPTGYVVTYEWLQTADGYSVKGTAVPNDHGAETIIETVGATYAVTKEATCTETGIGTWTSAAFTNSQFSVQTKEVPIPATGHSMTHHDAVSATCTEAGNVEYWSCSKCNKNFSDEAGTTAIETVVVQALGHHMTAHEAVEATCTTGGNSAYWSCDRCNKYFSDANGNTEIEADSWVIAAFNHDWNEPTYEWATDHTSVTATRICKNDPAHVETETATATGTVTTPATCTQEGVKAWTSAEFTNAAFEVQRTTETLPATGHDWNDPTYDWAADHTSVTATRTCKNDPAHVETDTASATGEVTKAATCTEDGVKTWTSAAFSNNAFAAQTATEEIPATGHKWIKPAEWTWTGDDENGYTKVGGTFTCQNDPEHIQLVETTEITSVKVDPTPTTAGSITYTAELTGPNNVVYDITKEVTLPATGFTYKDPVYSWTETTNGYNATALMECNEDQNQNISETVTASYAVTTPATCEATGTGTYTATFTNSKFETQTKDVTINALGHDWKFVEFTWEESGNGYTAVANYKCENDPTHTTTANGTVTYATTAATCETVGSTVYTATIAEAVSLDGAPHEGNKTVTISALGHSYGELIAEVPATCTEEGTAAHYECSACYKLFDADKNEKTEAELKIAALGHDWNEPTCVWNADHTSVTATFTCKRVTTHTETVTASGSAITSAVTVEPTATAPGERTYIATVTLDGKTYTVTDTEAIPATGSTVSGNITSYKGNNEEGQVTVQLFAGESETAAYTATVSSNTSYAFEGVADGTYTLKVSKKDHATRTYEITVSGSAVTQDVKIHLIGDINGDGEITTVDAARVNSHAKGKTLLTGYEFSCGDINGDGDITTVDAARTNAHAKGATLIW